jgi:hypothetical protein
MSNVVRHGLSLAGQALVVGTVIALLWLVAGGVLSTGL